MVEYHFPVPGSPNEKDIVIFTRRHWVAFLGQFLLSFLILIIPIVFLALVYFLNFDRRIFEGLGLNVLVLIFSIYYLIAITFSFIAWLSFYYSIYIVTKEEIIEITQVGFFGRKISQLSILRVQDVTSDIKGILPTFFAYGDVLVETASEQKESFLLQSVPNPQEICSKIMELHDLVVETEGRQEQLLEGEGTLAPGKINSEKEEAASQQEETQSTTPPADSHTKYQELLGKEGQSEEGEVSSEDLNKGGEIKL